MLARASFPGGKVKAGVALALALLIAGSALLSWPSAAQEQRQRPRTLLDFLFRRGGDDVQVPVKKRPTLKAKVKQRSKARKSSSQIVKVQEPEALAKLDTARTVIVVGDFMASGLAEGLAAAYAQNPGIKIIDRSNGSSGFVRADFHDWPAEIKTLIETEKPAAVVVMIGANDRQQMKIGDVREQPLSDAWTKQYEARTDAFAAAIKERGLPFVWVGLPAFKSTKVSSDLIALNDIYAKSAENSGGAFVDIWDGFVDENGAFVMNGPDMNGQPVRLRGSDGISLSKPGKRKVAFYVEKPLNKLLGSETVPSTGAGWAGSRWIGTGSPGQSLRRPHRADVDQRSRARRRPACCWASSRPRGWRPGRRASAWRSKASRRPRQPGRADDFGGARRPPATAATAPQPRPRPRSGLEGDSLRPG